VLNEHLTLTKNPRFYDAAHVRIDQVNYVPLEDSNSALKRIRADELDMQSPIPATNIDWLRANMGAALRMTPYLSLSYITMNNTRAPLNDVRVRKALNLALDREVVTGKVLKLGDLPAYAFVPPGIANFHGDAAMDFKSVPQSARVEQARALMQQAGYGAANPLHLTLETTHDPDNKRVAAVLQAMLRAINVDLAIQSADLQIHYRNMQTGNYEIATAVWIADFNDATNFLDLLQSASGNNYARYKSAAYDKALAAAQNEIDPTKRAQLLLGAEKIALKDYPWIPWRFRVTQNLVQPWVKGFVSNVRDYNRSRWLWIAGKPVR
jgi:oligopeptide transport system substrate-binding protein